MIDLTCTDRAGIARILNRMAEDRVHVEVRAFAGVVRGRIEGAQVDRMTQRLHLWVETDSMNSTLCEEPRDGSMFSIREMDRWEYQA